VYEGAFDSVTGKAGSGKPDRLLFTTDHGTGAATLIGIVELNKNDMGEAISQGSMYAISALKNKPDIIKSLILVTGTGMDSLELQWRVFDAAHKLDDKDYRGVEWTRPEWLKPGDFLTQEELGKVWTVRLPLRHRSTVNHSSLALRTRPARWIRVRRFQSRRLCLRRIS